MEIEDSLNFAIYCNDWEALIPWFDIWFWE